MQVDEISQEQLQHMAEQIRRATASRLSVVLCSGDSDKVEGAEAVQCAISGRSTYSTQKEQYLDAVVMVMRTANNLLRQISAGKMRLQVVAPDGTMELSDDTLDQFKVGR